MTDEEIREEATRIAKECEEDNNNDPESERRKLLSFQFTMFISNLGKYTNSH